MLNTDRVNVLNAAVPDLVKHLPHIESGLVGLMSELRVLVAHDFDEDLSHLSDDVERLFNGLSEIRDLRAIGVKDENLLRAEGDLTDTLHTIRTVVLGMIHNRTAKLRIHTEMAASRTDVDLSPVDITTDYLVLASAPADPIFEERGQVLQEFPVPDKGGAAGRVTGHFLMLPIDDPERVRDNATPLDTFFLPEGRSLNLRKGDQVILRTQGYAVGDVPFGVSDFKAQHKDVFLEAEDAGIIISGPATLSQCAKISLKTYKDNLSLIKSNIENLNKIDVKYLEGYVQKRNFQ